MRARDIVESLLNGEKTSYIVEKLALKGDYKSGVFMPLVAASYMLAPSTQSAALPLYKILVQKIQQQGKQLQSRYTFAPTQSDPYGSMKALKKSVAAQQSAGVRKPEIKVFSVPPADDHKDYPIDADTNTMLRWVHDAIAHLAGEHPFSGRGEFGAYNRHLKTLPRSVAPILFTEIVAQTCCYYTYGSYVTQKAAILGDFDYFNVGALSHSSPLNKFFVLQDKNLVPRDGFTWGAFSREHPDLAHEITRQRNPMGFKGYLTTAQAT